MWIKHDESLDLPNDEQIAILPLPNCFLFPHIEMPLTIVEPRYRQMLNQVLKSNNFIGIACLKEGTEKTNERLPYEKTIGVAYVKFSMKNSDGTSNILLKGISRAKIIKLIQIEPYPLATIQTLETTPYQDKNISKKMKSLNKLLLQKLLHSAPEEIDHIRQIESLKDPETLTSIAAYTANISPKIKQGLLENLNMGKRLDQLIQIIKEELLQYK